MPEPTPAVGAPLTDGNLEALVAAIGNAQWLAWAAGFIDGEGWIGIYRRPGRAVVPVMEVAQNIREPLDRLAEMFGGRVDIKHRAHSERYRGHAQTFHWRIVGACHARRILPPLMPLLLVKRPAAERVLAIAATISIRPPRKEVPHVVY